MTGGTEKPSTNDGPRSTFSVEAARNIGLLPAIYLYFAGFVYRDFFAHTFGIPAATETPVYTYLIYAYNALAPNLVWFVTVLLALFGHNMYATILATKTGRTRLESIVVSSEQTVFAIVGVALFPSLFSCAQKAALADAQAIRCGATSAATRVVLSFKPGRATTYEPDFISAIPLGPVYLLARTAHLVFRSVSIDGAPRERRRRTLRREMPFRRHRFHPGDPRQDPATARDSAAGRPCFRSAAAGIASARTCLAATRLPPDRTAGPRDGR